MYISSISVQNFRNYERAHVTFNAHLNLIIGDNAQGKTNLLESIYVGGFGKSFRATKDSELVRDGQDMAAVKMEVFKDTSVRHVVEYRLTSKSEKEFLINGLRIQKLSELLGTVNIILFYPDDLRLIKESPIERRRFLNRELSQISRLYCSDIIEYNKLLFQRNEWLKSANRGPSDPVLLDVWDEQLSDKGARIILKRADFIRQLSDITENMHAMLTSNKEKLSLNYMTAVKNICNYDTIRGGLLEALNQNRGMDIRRGFTSVGPHRDDMEIFINGKRSRIFASQGQQRTAALTLKLSEIEIVKREVGTYPIVLLDDVMSELDSHRQEKLLNALSHVQTIITATDTATLLKERIGASSVISVKKGLILT